MPIRQEEIAGLDADYRRRLKLVTKREAAALPKIVCEVEIIEQNPCTGRARDTVTAPRHQGRNAIVFHPPEKMFG